MERVKGKQNRMPILKLYSGEKPKPRPEILLHPNIPKPLHGLNPREIKGKEWWDRERRAAYKRANYYCEACGVHKTEAKYKQWLEAHECYEIDFENFTATYVGTVAICYSCHSYVHSGRMTKLVDTGQMKEKDVKKIIKHGDRVLKKAGLKRKPFKEDTVWGRWVLIVDGKPYKSKFRSYKQWFTFFNNNRENEEIR